VRLQSVVFTISFTSGFPASSPFSLSFLLVNQELSALRLHCVCSRASGASDLSNNTVQVRCTSQVDRCDVSWKAAPHYCLNDFDFISKYAGKCVTALTVHAIQSTS